MQLKGKLMKLFLLSRGDLENFAVVSKGKNTIFFFSDPGATMSKTAKNAHVKSFLAYFSLCQKS